MKTLFPTALLAALVLPVFSVTAADTSSVEQKLMQMERDATQAFLKNDTAALEKMYAEDWVGIDFTGKTVTRAEAMADMKSGASSSKSIELGPLKARVFGDTAVVTGSDTETSTYKGKDSTGKYAWTDVWVMRQGKWQVAASQATKIGK